MGQAEVLAAFSGFFGLVQLLLAWRLWDERRPGFPTRALALLFLFNGLVALDYIWRALSPGNPQEEFVRQLIDAPTPFLVLYLAFALPPANASAGLARKLLVIAFVSLFSALLVAAVLFDSGLRGAVNGLFAGALIYAAYGVLAIRLVRAPVLLGGRDISRWLVYAFVVRVAEFAIVNYPQGVCFEPALNCFTSITNGVGGSILLVGVALAGIVTMRALLFGARHHAPTALAVALSAGILLGVGQRGLASEIAGFISVLSLFVARPLGVGLALYGRNYLWDLLYVSALASILGATFAGLGFGFPTLAPDRLFLLAAGLALILFALCLGFLRGLRARLESVLPSPQRAEAKPDGPWDPDLAAGADPAFLSELEAGRSKWNALPPATRSRFEALTLAERTVLALLGESRDSAAGNERCTSRGLCLLVGTTSSVQRNFKDKLAEFEETLLKKYKAEFTTHELSTFKDTTVFASTRRGRQNYYYLTPFGESLARRVLASDRLQDLPPGDLRWYLNQFNSRQM